MKSQLETLERLSLLFLVHIVLNPPKICQNIDIFDIYLMRLSFQCLFSLRPLSCSIIRFAYTRSLCSSGRSPKSASALTFVAALLINSAYFWPRLAHHPQLDCCSKSLHSVHAFSFERIPTTTFFPQLSSVYPQNHERIRILEAIKLSTEPKHSLVFAGLGLQSYLPFGYDFSVRLSLV